MDIYSISKEAALRGWDVLSDIVKPSIRFNGGKYSLDDILDDIQQDTSQVWLASHEKTIYGVAITQIIDYPQKAMLLVLCLAGKDFHLWDNIVRDYLIPYAKEHDCRGIEFLGRKGWIKRAIPLGFHPVQTVFQLDLEGKGAELCQECRVAKM